MPVADILAAQPSVEWNVVEFDACATDVMEAVADSLTWLVNHGLADVPGSADPLGPGRPERGLRMSAAGSPGGAPIGVAVVGCGTVSEEYFPNLTSFPDLNVLFCADLDLARAKDQAAKYGVGASGSLAEALEHPGVELVVNLTLPVSHAEVASAAIAAGKHVWNEKPLTTDPATGRALLAQATQAGVRLGCAPDTVLGAGLQTARRLIADGAIGAPQTALTLMQSPGPESWHPSPEFLFQSGAGPLFDLGPYYFSALATIFGPAARVAAIGRRAAATRVIGSGPKAGRRVPGRRAHARRRAGRVRRRWRRFAAVQLRLTAAAARARGDHRD